MIVGFINNSIKVMELVDHLKEKYPGMGRM